MSVWENRSVEEQDKIRISLNKSLENLLRKDRRKKKIENVLCTRS